MTPTPTPTIPGAQLGRRLPAGSRFATVGDLYALTDDQLENVEVWVHYDGLGLDYWTSARNLCHRVPTSRESSLCNAPSGMVLVVRTVEP